MEIDSNTKISAATIIIGAMNGTEHKLIFWSVKGKTAREIIADINEQHCVVFSLTPLLLTYQLN